MLHQMIVEDFFQVLTWDGCPNNIQIFDFAAFANIDFLNLWYIYFFKGWNLI